MGTETRKCFQKRLRRGDFEKYFIGKGIDIGCGDDPLEAPRGTVDPWDQPRGDAQELGGVEDAAYDFVYSSHCLEHLRSVERALSSWVRILKPGGFLYFTVPDYSLYEKEQFPSRFNSDHKQTFSIHLTRETTNRATHWNVGEDLAPLLQSLGVEILEGFLENDHYNYALAEEVDQTHFPETLAQICIIGRKAKVVEVPIAAERPAEIISRQVVSTEPLRIYTGILGQIGDIVMFTPTVRRLKDLFPRSEITFAVSRKFREAGELVSGLPYVDRIFVTESYFENLSERLAPAWYGGWPIDLRGEDEIQEQRKHDIVLETRPRSRRMPWWKHAHQVEECAHMVGVPGPIDLQTEIAIPAGVEIPDETYGKIVLHNDPYISKAKTWPWDSLRLFVNRIGPENVVLLGNPGPTVEGALDYRGKTTLAQAAAIIAACACYVGIDSGLMWIAASLQVPCVGLYGTGYIPAYGAIRPKNPKAHYLQVEGTLDAIPSEAVVKCVLDRCRCDASVA
jgi:predicted SAM-dependent methyltransferase